jgi:ribokinase
VLIYFIDFGVFFMSQLVVLGSVNADHVLRVPTFPRPGETLYGHGYQVIPGGKGANQVVAAARLGADTGFIACVGDDAFGVHIRENFKSEGIDITGVRIEPDSPTGIAMIQVNNQGENSICISAEANGKLTSSIVENELERIGHADYLLTQLETPLNGIICAARFAKLHQTQVILNPAPAQTLPDELLDCVDMITPNETEAELLTGVQIFCEQDAHRAAMVLHEKGVPTVVITLGAQGVWMSESGRGKLIPGFRVKVLDTTAAGDTFNGALVTSLMENALLEHAVRFAQAAAAISVTRHGAQTSIPSKQEVDAFLLCQ